MTNEENLGMEWSIDKFDKNGMLIVLYRYERILHENMVKKGDNVLDIGGWGKLEHRLYQEGCKVCSMDIDINRCKSNNKRYNSSFNVINGDAIKLPFKNKSFDIVTCFEVFEHLNPPKRPEIIKEISRILKHKGNFIGTIPIPGFSHPKNDPTVNFMTPEEFNILISKNFDDITIEPTGSIKKENVS